MAKEERGKIQMNHPVLKFEFNSRIKRVEESGKQTFIEGTLISEGVSANGNDYTFESLRTVAKSAISAPLYYGTEGSTNKHSKSSGVVGRIVRTWFNKRFHKVYFRALITSRKIAETVKEGFGVSISGTVDAKNMIDNFGRIVQKIFSVAIEHVQLLSPFTKRGVQSAVVSRIVNETMTFRCYANNKILTPQEITLVILALTKSGDLE